MSRYSGFGIFTAIILTVLPFVASRHLFYGAINSKYFFITSVVSVFLLCFTYLKYKKDRTIGFKKRILLYLLSATLLVHYISAFTGIFPEVSLFSDIIRSTGVFFLTYIALFAVLLGELLTEKDWILVRRCIAFSGGLFALFSFLGREGLGLEGRFLTLNFEISGLTIGNTTFAGAFLLLTFIFTLLEFLRSEKGSKLKKFLFGALVLQFFSPFLINFGLFTGKVPFSDIISNPMRILGEARASGATLIAFVIYILGWFGIQKYIPLAKKKIVSVLWHVLWVVAILSSLVMLFIPDTFVQEKYIESSSAARIIVWESGFEAFKEKPILGWGPENFNQAFYKHFDSRLFLDENIGEIWFDKAHNIIVDTLVSVGVLGAVSILLMAVYLGFVFWKAGKRGLISNSEATILSALLFAHFLQLQTSFDTVATYTLVAVVFGYGLFLEKRIIEAESVLDKKASNKTMSQSINKIVALIMVAVMLFASYHLIIKERIRQDALLETFRSADSAEKQIDYIRKSVSRISSFETIRLSQASFLKGAFEEIASTSDGKPINIMIPYLSAYEEAHKKYLEIMPTDYRAHMNLAYVYILKTAFGENKISEAKALVENAYNLTPSHPLTYAMDALTDLYSGNVKRAKAKIEEGLALNPQIKFSQGIKEYILKQEAQFPEITIIKLPNL